MADQRLGKEMVREARSSTTFSTGLMLVVLSGLSAGMFWLDAEYKTGLSWLIVTFYGFAILIVLLFAGAIFYRSLGMSDPTQSMAMPRNSIRSLLTFLIFMFLMAFVMFSSREIKGTTGELVGTPAEVQKIIADQNLLVIEQTIEGTAGARIAKVKFRVSADGKMVEYFDRILIALLGIASSIVGFYFGQRSRENPTEAREDGGADDTTDEPDVPEPETPEPDAEDGAQPTLVSTRADFKKTAPGTFRTTLVLSTAEQAPGSEIVASFEPLPSHEKPWGDEAAIRTERRGETLDIVVSGLPEGFDPNGLKLSLYYADQEERAVTVPVSYTPDRDA